jgi:signal transduction histidine kinase
MYLSPAPSTDLWPSTPKRAVRLAAASAVLWAVVAALFFITGLDTFPRMLVFCESIGLVMVACVVLLQPQRRFRRLAAGPRWLLTGAIAIPTGYLLGHQIAFALLGEPMRLGGFHHVSMGPLLASVLLGGLGLSYFATREQLAREAAARAEAHRLAVESQLRLLRTQLEPHMLFNTLANLRGLVREDADRAETMIDQLIVYLRATLAASQTEEVPLAREFAQLQAYLQIMSLRMGPRLTWYVELPPALESAPVPPMLLQPLVENAIKHGLEPKVGPGHIDVVARATGAGIEIRVEDNGLGLSVDDGSDPARYGLQHVRERLGATDGPGARLDIERREPGGVRCVVFLPAR